MAVRRRPFRQIPQLGELYFDHAGLFVPDMPAASAALERLGFTLTPYAVHTMITEADATPRPSGTANRCVMLREGYLEILCQVNGAPLGLELRAAVERYTGIHLLAFATADAGAARDRIAASGYRTQPVVNLTRTVAAPDGTDGTLRFTVVRLEPEQMPEGRIQCLTHQTPGLLWQERYLGHANGALAVRDILAIEADIGEAAERFTRYLGRAPEVSEDAARFRLDRGTLTLAGPATLARTLLGAALPSLPFLAAQSIEVADITATERHLRRAGLPFTAVAGALVVPPDPAVGAATVFVTAEGVPPWLRA